VGGVKGGGGREDGYEEGYEEVGWGGREDRVELDGGGWGGWGGWLLFGACMRGECGGGSGWVLVS